MRYWILSGWALTLASAACGNTYHPEYHPRTSVQYSVTSTNPVHVNAPGQPVYVVPSPSHSATVLPAPPPPPPPPEDFPW